MSYTLPVCTPAFILLDLLLLLSPSSACCFPESVLVHAEDLFIVVLSHLKV